MVVFHNIEKMFLEAEEYIWRLTDRYMMTALDELETAVKKGVEVRLLESKDIVYPPAWDGPGPVISEATAKGQFINQLLERADVFIAMSEKEVACVSFPRGDGRFDYFGFHATDERSHRWCRDLFLYYWERSERRQ
jgi:predicted transcriptional regulator